MAQVAIVMGSNSDLPVVKGAITQLKKFGVSYEAHVISAHRTPLAAEQFAKSAKEKGIKVIIAAAGKAAHLGGVIAAYTTLPVIALPIRSSFMDGLDSLLSMVQMPSGIPVATVAINGGKNAGILAAKILATSDAALLEKLEAYSEEMKDQVVEKDNRLQETGYQAY